ncbi:MAG: YggS family pyridoxal phosphate-dependent enzyme [Chloroflexota bacterium]
MKVSPSDTTIAARLAAVRATIAATCARVDRPPESVTLIAVSKTHPPAALLEAIACDQVNFGENRVEEAIDKIPVVMAQTSVPLTWHMIGHVQSRKAEAVVQQFSVIHSVDSLKIAERYSRFATEQGKMLTILLEVNVSGESSKDGFAAAHWENSESQKSLWSDIRRIIDLPGLQVGGLMTIAPIVETLEQVRPVFSAVRRLRDALAVDFPQANWSMLSMGMTDDYTIAIEEGATFVRIGRAIFGSRS